MKAQFKIFDLPEVKKTKKTKGDPNQVLRLTVNCIGKVYYLTNKDGLKIPILITDIKPLGIIYAINQNNNDRICFHQKRNYFMSIYGNQLIITKN